MQFSAPRDSLTQVMMPALGNFVMQLLLLFLLGAMFGKLMEDSGAARKLAEAMVARLGAANTIPAVVLACAVLTYGGVSLFVVAFAVAPLAAELFARSRLPHALIPATITLGAFTFTMTALPGTPRSRTRSRCLSLAQRSSPRLVSG